MTKRRRLLALLLVTSVSGLLTTTSAAHADTCIGTHLRAIGKKEARLLA